MAKSGIKEKRKIFKKEIKRCFLLPKSEREYWLNEADNLPQIVIDDLLKKVRNTNKQTDKYIEVALQADKKKQFGAELKQVYEKTKRNMVADNESVESETAEESLQNQLDKI